MTPEDCARYYSCQFPAMVADWQSSFAQPWAGTGVAFTFLFVGLTAYVQDLPSQVSVALPFRAPHPSCLIAS